MKIDLVFLIILGIVIGYVFMLHRIDKVESMADVAISDQVKEAVRQVYLADVEAIRNLSNIATQLQTNGLTVPAHMNIKGKMNIGSNTNAKDFPDWLGLSVENAGDSNIRLKTKSDDNKNVYMVNRDGNFKVNTHGIGDMFGVNRDGHISSRHTGDHVLNLNGDGNNPFISLGKTDTWEKKKIFIQNVDAHTETPTFRVGVHGAGPICDMKRSGSGSIISIGSGWQLDTADGRLRIKHESEKIGRDILAELDKLNARLNARFPSDDTIDLTNGRIMAGGNYFHMMGPGGRGSLEVATKNVMSKWNGF